MRQAHPPDGDLPSPLIRSDRVGTSSGRCSLRIGDHADGDYHVDDARTCGSLRCVRLGKDGLLVQVDIDDGLWGEVSPAITSETSSTPRSGIPTPLLREVPLCGLPIAQAAE